MQLVNYHILFLIYVLHKCCIYAATDHRTLIQMHPLCRLTTVYYVTNCPDMCGIVYNPLSALQWRSDDKILSEFTFL